MPQLTTAALINLVDELLKGRLQSHPERLHVICLGSLRTEKEIIMNDHCGHGNHAPAKAGSPSKNTTPTPVIPDPHAGHDMGKPETPAVPGQPADKK